MAGFCGSMSCEMGRFPIWAFNTLPARANFDVDLIAPKSMTYFTKKYVPSEEMVDARRGPPYGEIVWIVLAGKSCHEPHGGVLVRRVPRNAGDLIFGRGLL
jgi:hypothetical protein